MTENNPVYHVWTGFEKKFQNPSFTLQGHSISARCTAFYLKEFKILFDAGIRCPFLPEFVFISHAHSDHSAQLPLILTAYTVPKKTQVFVPKGTKQNFINLLLAYVRLSNDDSTIEYDEEKASAVFTEVDDNCEFDIEANGSKLHVKTFATTHKVRSIGYALFSRRKRLKEEFRGKSGAELARARSQGIELSEQFLAPLIAFVGDSTPRWLSNDLFNDYKFPYIIAECTFVGALEDLERARKAAEKHRHTLWEELQNDVENRKETTFILSHWSNRYTIEEIESFFEPFENVFPWTW